LGYVLLVCQLYGKAVKHRMVGIRFVSCGMASQMHANKGRLGPESSSVGQTSDVSGKGRTNVEWRWDEDEMK